MYFRIRGLDFLLRKKAGFQMNHSSVLQFLDFPNKIVLRKSKEHNLNVLWIWSLRLEEPVNIHYI